MNDIESIIKMLSFEDIYSIEQAASFSYSQTEVFFLFISYMTLLSKDKVDISILNKGTIDIGAYHLKGEMVLSIIESIKLREDYKYRIIRSSAKNFFRGTATPIYEISKNKKVRDLLSLICFDDSQHFNNFYNIIIVIRHQFTHTYSDRVKFRERDLDEDKLVKKLINSGSDAISFTYDGNKYFPEVYSEDKFIIDISLNLSEIEIGKSLFDVISIDELLFLGEICNNLLAKTVNEIRRVIPPLGES